jgi:putative SOS response-associated peptidase YedK
LINAKAETVAGKLAFRDAFKERRCIIPADGFYEWKKLDAKTKQPYAIVMKDRSVFGFAARDKDLCGAPNIGGRTSRLCDA